MRFLGLVAICVASVVLPACGGGDSTESSTAAAKADRPPLTDSPKPPRVEPPHGPPPTHLVVEDLRQGSGPPIPPRLGVRVRTNYIAYGYKAGRFVEVRWQPSGGFNIGLDPGKETEGWEKGMVGMKAGGRRTLKVPARMAYGDEALFYVVDLLGIEWPPFG